MHLTIKSGIHDYEVTEVDDLGVALAKDFTPSSFALVDRRVAELYPKEVEIWIGGGRCRLIDASEEAKSYDAIGPIIQAVLEAGFQRRSTLCVIGGGVVQDIGCFIATNLIRGVPWIFYPSTLLAQCDSCIGAKSSVNIGRFKNQLGSFYPPNSVRIFPEFLDSLPRQDRLSGLGEAIKLHLIAGEPESVWLGANLPLVDGDRAVLHEIVRSSLRIKQRYIEEDEFDRGIRNLLNYGHTFAHAFESATRYAIPHGIAVTMGVASATWFSEKLGYAKTGYFSSLVPTLRPFYEDYLPALRSTDPSAVLAAMKLDKKNSGDGITFILTEGAGKMFKHPIAHHEIANTLPSIINNL